MRGKIQSKRSGVKVIWIVSISLFLLALASVFYLNKKETEYIKIVREFPIEIKKEFDNPNYSSFIKKEKTSEDIQPYYNRMTMNGKNNVLLTFALGHWEKKYKKEIDKTEKILSIYGLKLTFQDEINSFFSSNDTKKAINGAIFNFDLTPKNEVVPEELIAIKQQLNRDLFDGKEHSEWKQQMQRLIRILEGD